MREAVLGKRNTFLWHHYNKGALRKSAEEKYNFRAHWVRGRGWLMFSFFTSKIKPRGGVGRRHKEGRKGSEIADRVMNENERIRKIKSFHKPVL